MNNTDREYEDWQMKTNQQLIENQMTTLLRIESLSRELLALWIILITLLVVGAWAIATHLQYCQSKTIRVEERKV